MHFVLSHTPFPLSYVPMINTAYSDEMTILQAELYIVTDDALNLLELLLHTVKILKSGKIFICFAFTVRPVVTCGSRVSRAPPHHTLPAFLNLHGIIFLHKFNLKRQNIKVR